MTDTWQPDADIESLADLIESQAPYVKPPSGKDAQAEHRTAITEMDMDKLLAIQDKMKAAVDKATANINVTPEQLDLEEVLLAVFDELIDNKDIESFGKARYDMLRTILFNKITSQNMAKGIPDPDMAPGYIEVPDRGSKITREGGRKLVDLDHKLLAKKLGKKRWERVSKAVVVPAVPEHVEIHLDHEALQELVNEDPKVLELFRASLEITGYTPQKLFVRRLEE